MSTREKLYNIIDCLTDDQIEGLLTLLNGFIKVDEPNKETLSAIEETEKMKLHPENYKSYNNADEMLEDLLK